MIPPDKTQPIKPGAKLDPKGSALVKKMKELKAQAEIGGEHVGRIRTYAEEPSAGQQLQLRLWLLLGLHVPCREVRTWRLPLRWRARTFRNDIDSVARDQSQPRGSSLRPAMGPSAPRGSRSAEFKRPAVGIGYRRHIDEWTRANLARFDVLEITLDHCLTGSEASRAAIFDLVGQIPLTAHGIGLSIGTDTPLDLAYLDEIAAIIDRLKAPAYSEHLAFTRVPGRDLGNLLPLPRTTAIAESIIAKVRTVQSRIPVPFLLENITYIFDWPDSELSDAEFLSLICGETGAGILLDVENLYLNGRNHGFDPYAFLDGLPANAGHGGARGRWHRSCTRTSCHGLSSRIPIPTRCRRQHSISSITRSRDRRRASSCSSAMIASMPSRKFWMMSRVCVRGSTADLGSLMPDRLLNRQVRLLEHLTSGDAIFGADRELRPIPPDWVSMAACFISRHAFPTRSGWRRSSGC